MGLNILQNNNINLVMNVNFDLKRQIIFLMGNLLYRIKTKIRHLLSLETPRSITLNSSSLAKRDSFNDDNINEKRLNYFSSKFQTSRPKKRTSQSMFQRKDRFSLQEEILQGWKT
jgi:hypothetical protein